MEMKKCEFLKYNSTLNGSLKTKMFIIYLDGNILHVRMNCDCVRNILCDRVH